MQDIIIEPIQQSDQAWIKELLEEQWGSVTMVTRGKTLDATQLPDLKPF